MIRTIRGLLDRWAAASARGQHARPRDDEGQAVTAAAVWLPPTPQDRPRHPVEVARDYGWRQATAWELSMWETVMDWSDALAARIAWLASEVQA